MNAIEQMMQAPGANSNQAISALFGSQKASEGEESAFAAVFANLMQNFAADGTKEITSPDAIKALEDLSPAETEFLASLGVQIPAAQEPAAFQGPLTAGDTPNSNATVSFQKVSPSALIEMAFANANGEASPTLDLTEITALPEGARAELLQALKGMQTNGEPQSLTLTAPDGEAHILPISELAALINGTTSENGTLTPIAKAPVDAPAPAVVAVPTPASSPVQTPASVGPAAPQAPVISETLAAGLVSGSAEDPAATLDPAQVTGATAPAAAQPEAGADVTQAEMPDMAVAAAAANAAAAKQANQQPAQVQQQASEQAQAAPDGYMVAANQQQANTAANAGNPAGKKAATPTPGDKTPVSDSLQTAASQTKGEALTARAIDPVMARSDVALPPSAAREPSLTMTPERLAGLPDGSASEVVSSGLSGMRGDSSGFMSSMSLLGGHASRGLQGHVAKQLNMSVSKAVKAGENEFTLRLDPAELGRVQVKLRFLEGGRVHAQVAAERPETLEMLQRDARGLERAIQGAGGKAQGTTIEFSLDQGNNQESAGKAFAEAVQQEKMRDALAARSAGGQALPFGDDEAGMEDVPLDDILPYVDADTGLDIRV